MRSAKLLLVLPLLFSCFFSPVPALEAQTLRGSRASVERIHRQAVNQNLHFYETSAGVHRAVAQGRLVHLKGNANYRVHGARYPYALPETHTFVTRLAAQYRSHCGEPLVVTSAVRPRSFRLVNSSPRSVHPTGMAVDLRKSSRPRCLAWLRSTLLALEAAGVIEAVEEFNPPHFHVAVFPRQYHQYVARQGGQTRVAAAPAARPQASTSRAQPARPAPRAGAARTTTYQVRRGDSLWTIARRHGTSVEQLQRANNLRSSRIVAGQRLVVPAR